jgi:hypothetical protein
MYPEPVVINQIKEPSHTGLFLGGTGDDDDDLLVPV